jgi:hypothetical protein
MVLCCGLSMLQEGVNTRGPLEGPVEFRKRKYCMCCTKVP